MKEYRITVRVTADLRRRLKAEAKRTGKRESEVVREAVERRLNGRKSQPTAYDLWKKAGLIGCIKGTPPDLSTNPKYMEGFGDS